MIGIQHILRIRNFFLLIISFANKARIVRSLMHGTVLRFLCMVRKSSSKRGSQHDIPRRADLYVNVMMKTENKKTGTTPERAKKVV